MKTQSSREAFKPFANAKVSEMIPLLEIAVNNFNLKLKTKSQWIIAVRFVNNSRKKN